MRGPIDYTIIGFEENKFYGIILAAVGDEIENGVIGLLVMAGVVKDADGPVSRPDVASIVGEVSPRIARSV